MSDTARTMLAGVHYIVTGSFKSAALYLLAFDPVNRSLQVALTTEAYGPHQYLATNAKRDRIYATTWATPSILSSFAVEQSSPQQAPLLRHLNNVDIPATSSYVLLSDGLLYSAGGHYAEIHDIDADGSIGNKVQQLEFLPADQMKSADKTRKALRVGTHGFDLNSNHKAFIPHLGTNSIWVYDRDRLSASGKLNLIGETKSPREGDGPRHVWPSANGDLLYSVTEHTNFIDVFRIRGKTLQHLQSGQIVPKDKDPHKYRGNTLRLSRDGRFIFGSTRGSSPSIKGYVTAFELKGDGTLASEDAVAYYETPTCGGIAGAIEPAFWKGSEGVHGQDYIALVDDEQGWVHVLGWCAKLRKFSLIASTKLEDAASASHAIWLS